jgi:predicted Zn-dependent peptidase
MNRRGLLLLLLLLGLPAAALATLPPAVEEFALTNGMRFLLVPRRDQPHVISAGWLARVGSAYEAPGHTGLSHFFEHLMFKGTEKLGKDEFTRIYTREGATSLNAFTSEDLTLYFCTVPANKLELWAWMESDRLQACLFREFDTERDVVLEERRLRVESTPTGRLREQFEALAWGAGSCYASPVIGWPGDIQGFSLPHARDFWDRYYRAGNLVGLLVGDFEPSRARALVTAYFSRLPAGTPPPPPSLRAQAVPQVAEQRLVAAGDFPSGVTLRYPTVPAGHADSYALDLLAEILNEQTGRLYAGLIEGRKLATRARAESETRKFGGGFALELETRGSATPEHLEAAWYVELAALQQQVVPERELRKVKNRLAANHYRRIEQNLPLLIQMAFAEATVGWRELLEAPQKYEAATAADLQRVANSYFRPEQRSVAVYRREAPTPTTPPSQPPSP